MDRLIANSLEHVRNDDIRLFNSRITLSHEDTNLRLEELRSNPGEFAAISIGNNYAYAASLPVKDGILKIFNRYAEDRYRGRNSSAEMFQQAKQDAFAKSRSIFGHVDTTPFAQNFQERVPPNQSFKQPVNVPQIMKKMADMIRSGQATITGTDRTDAEMILKTGDRVTLSIFKENFEDDQNLTHVVPGFRITVSNTNKPAATYMAVLPTKSTATTLYYRLQSLNPEFDGVLMMQEADPNANMFTDEVIDYFIAHTAHVGEKPFLRAMQDNYPSAFSELNMVDDDQFYFNQQQKMAALGSIKRMDNEKSSGVIQALRNWGYDRGRQVFSGFADMAAM